MTVTVNRSVCVSRQRSFDRFYAEEIKVAAGKLAEAAQRRNVAEEIVQSEGEFIANTDFAALTISQIDASSTESPMFSTKKNATRADGVIDVMASNALLTHHGEQHLFRKMNYLFFWANAFRASLNPQRASAKAIARIQVLMAEAQKCRSTIVNSNLRLVLSLGRKFSNSDLEFEDLVSEGSMILVKAVDKFDYSRGFRFSTYATHSIQRHFYRRWKTNQRRSSVVQVSAPEMLAELVPVEQDQVDEESVDVSQLQPIIQQMSDQLDEREQHIVLERYGLGPSGVAQTLRSLAADLGISKERVRQLQIKAIEKLQDIAMGLCPGCPIGGGAS